MGLIAGLLCLLSACLVGESPNQSNILAGVDTNPSATTMPLSPQSSTPTTTITLSPSLTWTPTWTDTPIWTGTPTLVPTHTATPDPYAYLSIEALSGRQYGGGTLEIHELLAENSYYKRYLISYPSDGLTIYGFMNVPLGEGSFPVVIALHGYIDPAVYMTLDYTTGYADALARAGYFVIHPNLRDYPPSDEGPNLFRVGMAIDVLNLIALVQSKAGLAGALEHADPQKIGLWGHSMGGGISTRVMTVNQDIRAVLLYAAMSGDENQNYNAIFAWSNGERGAEELSFSQESMQRFSPINYLERVHAAVSIHHGRSDQLVPLAWSLDLCERLRTLGKEVECYTYDGQPHTFEGDGNERFIQRMIDFFDRYLRAS